MYLTQHHEKEILFYKENIEKEHIFNSNAEINDNKLILDISTRNNEELKNLQNINNETIKLLSIERNKMSDERTKLLEYERTRLKIQHSQELLKKEKQFELTINKQNKKNDQEYAT